MYRGLSAGLLVLPLVSAPFAACGTTSSAPPTRPPAPPLSTTTERAPAPLLPPAGEPEVPHAASEPPSDTTSAPCPRDMIHVEGTYCPKVERTCLRKERNKPNHIEICHRFAHRTTCLGAEEKRSFCMDKYEYPNREGAHPPWMVSWYDAQATCGAKGKRLCYESEWVTACEGPDHTPFPYGWDRDQNACNVDNQWIDPKISAMYSKDAAVASTELERLDQSVPSGALAKCVSGYGVHDLTGNFDEWVTSDQPPEDKSEWAGLKGGAWGHVRNACRPMTTSHPPDFTYYFISFRCCADPTGAPPYVPKHGKKAPAVPPGDRAPLPEVRHAPGPSTRKVQPEN